MNVANYPATECRQFSGWKAGQQNAIRQACHTIYSGNTRSEEGKEGGDYHHRYLPNQCDWLPTDSKNIILYTGHRGARFGPETIGGQAIIRQLQRKSGVT